MPYHNPNSRSRRNVLRIVGVLVVLAVIASVANFLHTTTSEAASNVKPQIETMQGIRQTAQDSITFAQGLDDPDRFAAHIETVQQCMDDYDRLADAKQIKYLLSDNLQERIIGLLYRNQQRTIIDSMRVAAHNLDGQTKELLSAVDAAMADDFSQHAAQRLLQVDDPTQANELIDRYGKQRAYASMREMLADLRSLHKLRSDVKQQVSTAVSNLHNAEAAAAAIAVPERNGDLDPAGWYTLATNVASTMGVQIEQTMEFNCGGQSGENPSGFVAAYYCQMPDRSQRNVVHMLTTHPDWTQTARSPWLVDMVKHELSHRSIMISCGTTQPTIAADRTEAVTNSYSVLTATASRISSRVSPNTRWMHPAISWPPPSTMAIAGEVSQFSLGDYCTSLNSIVQFFASSPSTLRTYCSITMTTAATAPNNTLRNFFALRSPNNLSQRPPRLLRLPSFLANAHSFHGSLPSTILSPHANT